MSKDVTGPSILLGDGQYFNFLEPERSAVSIDVIATALSNLCRFTGQCEQFYSVAEHSVWCSYKVEKGYEYEALMHDTPEALIGDVSKPLKMLLPDYRSIEARVEAYLAKRFGFTAPMPDAVKKVDLQMLVTEQVQIMKNHDNWVYALGEKPLKIKLACFNPTAARERFLARYHELKAGRNNTRVKRFQ